MSSDLHSDIKKRYVRVGDRHMHFRTAGSGPPLVLMHDSPRSSVLLIPLIDLLSDRFTVFGFDSPGFGLSDPLPKDPIDIADTADAIAATMRALGIAQCSAYGTHTSSKIAISLASRHPDLMTCILLDGVSVISNSDEDFLKGYMQSYEVADNGTHLTKCWSKMNDQFRHFPWHMRTTQTRLDLDAPEPEQIQPHLMDLFYAGPRFHVTYSAAFRNRPAKDIENLRVPTNIVCRADDVLLSQLENLPPNLPECVSVERLPADDGVWKSRIKEIFESHRDHAAWSHEQRSAAGGVFPAGLKRSYLDLAHGQVAVRKEGDPNALPLLVLHDVPGAHSHLMPLVEAFGQTRYALTLDLPGCGESDPLPVSEPAVSDYVGVLKEAIGALDLAAVDLYAPGIAAPFAVELAISAPDTVKKVILDGGFILSEAQRAEFVERYCPSLTPTWEGAHLARAWTMLRNAEQAFPWYDLTRNAIRWRDQSLDPELRHARLFDVLKQRDIYNLPCLAAFNHVTRERLPLLEQETLLFTAERDPLYAWADDAARLVPNAQTMRRPAQDGALVESCLAFLNG